MAALCQYREVSIVNSRYGLRVLRILLVDDHLALRRALRRFLASEYPGARFAEASNGRQALKLLMAGRWDLVLLDLSLSGPGGLELLRQVRRRRPGTPTLALSLQPEHLAGLRSLRSGASGFVPKHSSPEVLVTAMNSVLAGGTYFTRDVAKLHDGGKSR